MKKKVLIALTSVVCMVLLVVGSIAGTVAYLTSQAAVTNTFTVGNVSITMVETKVDEYGVALTGNDAGTTDEGNEYKLIPGRKYTKDPTITVGADSEACYIFFKLENGLEGAATFNINGENWIPVTGETNVYYYKDIATAGNSYNAFTEMTIADDADVAAYKDANGDVNAKINVTAYAIQADGFADAAAAWAASGWATTNP